MSQDEAAGLHEKLDELVEAFARHEARESLWQDNITEKLDEHLESHKANDERWRNGWVGLAFTLLGGIILGLYSWLTTGQKP